LAFLTSNSYINISYYFQPARSIPSLEIYLSKQGRRYQNKKVSKILETLLKNLHGGYEIPIDKTYFYKENPGIKIKFLHPLFPGRNLKEDNRKDSTLFHILKSTAWGLAWS
jgi:hypothetical protein